MHKPTEPTEPTKPTEPTEPTKPTEPTEPATAAEPTELTSPPTPTAPPPPLHALLQRWFIEYNPIYLVSAAAVLVGVYLISDGLATQDGTAAQLAVFGITELYQLALIGAAGLLYRLGQRRPATMLALLTVVYLVDLTLQTAVSPYLGGVGIAASLGWLALTALKLRLLAWALRLRVCWAAYALWMLGAAGLALFPHLLASHELSPTVATMAVSCWIFALAVMALWTRRRIESRDPLDAWGQRVLQRALIGSWVLWALPAAHHLVWWTQKYDLLPTIWWLSVVPLLATRLLRREITVVGVISGVLLVDALLMPSMLSMVAVMASVVLLFRGLRGASQRRPWLSDLPSDAHPYRALDAPEMPEMEPPKAIYERASPWRPEAQRLYVGGLSCLYLAGWTAGWQGGPWPSHLWLLDSLFALVLLAIIWRWRNVTAGLTLTTMVSHLTLTSGWVPLPSSTGQLGVVVLVSGFMLLGAGVLLNTVFFRAARAVPTHPPSPGELPREDHT
ncbi:MAG: hypothetical protein JRH20_30000 [Deltaproteobacteria bacterium]|nr:hypothetical protein [Deltaproteobacteria bacterium]